MSTRDLDAAPTKIWVDVWTPPDDRIIYDPSGSDWMPDTDGLAPESDDLSTWAHYTRTSVAKELAAALRKLLTEGLAIHGDDLADPRTIDKARDALALVTSEEQEKQ